MFVIRQTATLQSTCSVQFPTNNGTDRGVAGGSGVGTANGESTTGVEDSR